MADTDLQNDDDVEAILKIAVNQAGLSSGDSLRERLMLAANELGLSPEQVQEAERQYLVERQEKAELKEFTVRQRREFFSHLSAYLVVNTFLVILNLSLEGTVDWAFWPIFGWGIGIVFSFIGTMLPKSAQFREDFEKWQIKKHRRDGKHLNLPGAEQ